MGKLGHLRRLVDFSLTPALSQREREPISLISKFECDSIVQIGGYRKRYSVSSLSPRERAGVRAASFSLAHQL